MNKGKENSNVSLGKKEIKDPLRKQDDGLIIKWYGEAKSKDWNFKPQSKERVKFFKNKKEPEKNPEPKYGSLKYKREFRKFSS